MPRSFSPSTTARYLSVLESRLAVALAKSQGTSTPSPSFVKGSLGPAFAYSHNDHVSDLRVLTKGWRDLSAEATDHTPGSILAGLRQDQAAWERMKRLTLAHHPQFTEKLNSVSLEKDVSVSKEERWKLERAVLSLITMVVIHYSDASRRSAPTDLLKDRD